MVEAAQQPIRVVLADDHPVVLEGLRAFLEQLPDLEVVGVCGSGVEVLELTRRLTPDVIVLDYQIPPPFGAELIRQVREMSPGSRVLILTAHGSDENVIAALTGGAAGYVSKESPVEQLADAIRQVHGGNLSLRADLTSHLLTRLMAAPAKQRGSEAMLGITKREMEVLQLLVSGATNEEIATRLFVSVRTVKAHLASIFQKLGVTRRTSAATAALRLGLVRTQEDRGDDAAD